MDARVEPAHDAETTMRNGKVKYTRGEITRVRVVKDLLPSGVKLVLKDGRRLIDKTDLPRKRRARSASC